MIHIHITVDMGKVLHVDVHKANNWSDREVIAHWHQYFKGTKLTERFLKGDVLDPDETRQFKSLVATYRARLCDISWFMRVINEKIARKANAEGMRSRHTKCFFSGCSQCVGRARGVGVSGARSCT